MILLHELNTFEEGEVTKRPSQFCKTPYVADVKTDNIESIMAHSPSLGCRGLADKNAKVILSKKRESKNNKCSHTIDLSIYKEGENETVIGINPNLAEIIAEKALINNCPVNLYFDFKPLEFLYLIFNISSKRPNPPRLIDTNTNVQM